MNRLKMPLLTLALASCAPAKPACSPESLDALKVLYSKAARDVIESGACDGVKLVQDCPEYRMIELHYYAVGSALCGGTK